MKFVFFVAFLTVLALGSCFPNEGAKTKEAAAQVKPEEIGAELGDDGKCVPGTQFHRECNICTCPSNGSKAVAACTLKLCQDYH